MVGYIFRGISEYELAESYLKQAIEVCHEHLGLEHPITLEYTLTLGYTYINQGRLREAEPLITKILDSALRVMGINPIRFLAAPILIAMMVMVPVLTILGDFMGLLGGGLYTSLRLKMSLSSYMHRALDFLSVDDIRQGLIKSFVFASIIAMVGISNGFQVRGGAEGVGRATTRSVVMSISLIIISDMIFTFLLNP